MLTRKQEDRELCAKIKERVITSMRQECLKNPTECDEWELMAVIELDSSLVTSEDRALKMLELRYPDAYAAWQDANT